jgi:hypothetical protein
MSKHSNYYELSVSDKNINIDEKPIREKLYKSNDFKNNYFNAGIAVDDKIDYQILMDDDIPGPVKNSWKKIKEKIHFVKQQNKLNTVYINDYLQRDNNYETKNFIKYTWNDIQVYNLSKDTLNIFKSKLIELLNLIQK